MPRSANANHQEFAAIDTLRAHSVPGEHIETGSGRLDTVDLGTQVKFSAGGLADRRVNPADNRLQLGGGDYGYRILSEREWQSVTVGIGESDGTRWAGEVVQCFRLEGVRAGPYVFSEAPPTREP
jgi:hypothetical protein